MSRWQIVMGGVMLCVSGVTVGVPRAEAHLRDYLMNEPYYTAKQGEFEVELRNDGHFTQADNSRTYSTEHQIELEYGLLDHLQLAYYEVYTWDQTKQWDRDAFKVEAKLRFAEAGQWPVDVALYTEYRNPDGPRRVNSDELENKIIMSKDIGPWNVIGNFTFERKINVHDEWHFEYTAGASYPLSARTRVGLEVLETLGGSEEFGLRRKDHQLYLVPGVYTSLTPHLRLVAGPAFGLTRASDDLQLRTILEMEF